LFISFAKNKNKLFGYTTGNDKELRKILNPDLRRPKTAKTESEELKLREQFYKDELRYHLRWDRRVIVTSFILTLYQN